MVTKGYQKGVYERVTMGTGEEVTVCAGLKGGVHRPGTASSPSMNVLWGRSGWQCIFPRTKFRTPQAEGKIIYDLDQDHSEFRSRRKTAAGD
jgi:hypothetical protein